MARRRGIRRRWLGIGAGYLLLLLLSHVWRGVNLSRDPGRSLCDRSLRSFDAATGDSIDLAFRDDGEPGDERPVLLTIHGSPGTSGDFAEILRHRTDAIRWISVDLPGFGASTHALADYSFETHAAHVEELMRTRGVERAHLLAFSMGGGPALQLHARAPERVASLILLGSIGVQELELLGDYALNHAIHGLQLGGIWLLQEALPHFGWLDRSMMDLPYARNFYDSDQRPLRGLLTAFSEPVLILHGRNDPLVPLAAALEHRRILPQSELRLFPGGHFLPWQRGGELSEICEQWVTRVEAGGARVRSTAEPERRRAARLSFAELPQPRAEGIGWLLLVALLVLGTFVAEDLTCLGAGILIAQGRLGWVDGMLACAGGIFFGDLLLYAGGRFFGGALFSRRPLRWLLSPRSLRRAEHWFARRGLAVIFITRFLPGTRLPAYVAAGVLRTPFTKFAGYFLMAVLLWTPLIVGASAFLGSEALARLRRVQHAGFLLLLLFGAILLTLRLVLTLSTWRGRRLWWGRWQRCRRWEFWPSWLLYLFLLPHLAGLARRHGGFHVATAVNPGIETGGLLGESKSRILEALGAERPEIARFVSLPAGGTLGDRLGRLEDAGLRCPLVVKPDVGERGRGVQICRDESELRERLGADDAHLLVQEFVDGPEFGVFYVRDPGTGGGRLLSVARKRLPTLRGDGESTVEELILADDRAVCMASFHLDRLDARLEEIPGPGERLPLADVGTHCRGAVFLDGSDLRSQELLGALEELVGAWPGFHFGRFDIKAPSEEDLKAGRGLRVLELNGLSSEAAHVYDPKYSLAEALRCLRGQWSLAFDIAAAQIRDGARPTPRRELARMALRHFFGPSA